MSKFFIFVAFVIVIVGILNYFGYADVGFFSKDEFDREQQCTDVTFIYNKLVRYYSDFGSYPRNLEELTPEYIVNIRKYLGHYGYAGTGTGFAITFTSLDDKHHTITNKEELTELCNN